MGVVLCPPLGFEAIASRRSLRTLAETLRQQGFAVMRFDYRGTGDSGGDDASSGQLSAWIESIELAIDELKRLSRVPRVSLCGVHLGATLAYTVATRREDAESLVMWAPFLTGRSYLREARAYSKLNPYDPPWPWDDGGYQEASGFALSAETASELSTIDLVKSNAPAVRAALVLSKDRASPEPKLVDALEGRGVHCELLRTSGYAEMMQEPRKSIVPQEAFGEIEAWLLRTHPQTNEPVPPSETTPAAVLHLPGAHEHSLFFGPDERLFGIRTEPTETDGTTRPTLVWLNTASDHRIGPHRQYVTMARRLAGLGFTSFRFDPRGVGDCQASEAPDVAHAYSPQRLEDTRDALAWLSRQYGTEEFVLIGLCSGAYVAFHLALSDPRVVGEILINPQTFHWREGDSLEVAIRGNFGSTRFYRRRIRDPQTWRRALRGEVNVAGVIGILQKRIKERAVRRIKRWLPLGAGSEIDVEGAFRKKLRRGASTLIVCGESSSGLDYIEARIGSQGRSLRRFPRFRMDVVQGANHTFTHRWMKQWLSDRIVQHLTSVSAHGGATSRERAGSSAGAEAL